MDKNSTTISTDSRITATQSAEPSRVTLSRIRQFARAYVCFQQASPMGGIILN